MDENKTPNSNPTPESETGEVDTPRTFTQEEVERLIQSETDKRTNQALSKQKKEYEKKLSLSGLDEEKRAQAEKDLRIKELEDSLKEFKTLQVKAEVVKTLSGRGLNPSFADLIYIDEDTEAAQERINALDTLFKAAVQEEVKKRLGTTSPKSSSTTELTKESFRKLPLDKKQEIYKTNPELYKKLAGI